MTEDDDGRPDTDSLRPPFGTTDVCAERLQSYFTAAGAREIINDVQSLKMYLHEWELCL